jgi:hypothetical protein
MKFEHKVIDASPAGTLNDVCLITDVNGNGYNDIIIGGKQGEGNVVWYEYPDWKRHPIGNGSLEAGGIMYDVNGNGRSDLIAGEQQGPNLYWYENSGDPGKEWTRRVICKDFCNYHDQAIGDIDNDGEAELVVPSQGQGKKNGIIVYYDLPADPTVGPWPQENQHEINRGLVLEGMVVTDLDGDGQNELVAGSHWFKKENGEWKVHTIDDSYRLLCVKTGDLFGDGKEIIVMTEGESFPGRVAWVSPYPELKVQVLANDLFHPHSLALADICGNGRLDIFVGEMGLGKHQEPKLMVFENNGDGTFKKHIISEGVPTHNATVGDIGKSGSMSIVGKPYNPENQVDLWLNLKQ